MSSITYASAAWNGFLDSLVELLEKHWKPSLQPPEVKYRDELLKFIRKNIPEDAQIEREYRHLGTTADLYLSWPGLVFSDEVFIEIKKDLRQKTAFDRLVGQVEGIDPKERKVLLVWIGETDDALVGRLKKRYAEHLESAGNMRIARVINPTSRKKTK